MTELVSPDPQVSVRHQCELLDLCRSSYYYTCCPESPENLALMRRIDEMFLHTPSSAAGKWCVSCGATASMPGVTGSAA